MFHNAIKARRLQNSVYGIADMNGQWVESVEEVNKAFLQYYIVPWVLLEKVEAQYSKKWF